MVGPVVLRAQGTLEIAGTLRRSCLVPSEADFPKVTLGTSLSDCVDRLLTSHDPWTILVAGGDLRVTGRISVDGPLVLISGGWIRASGSVQASEVWKTREGGGDLPPAPLVHDLPSQLVIDAPAHNPLRVVQRWAALSAPIRPPGGVASWETATRAGRDGAGSARVRFYGLRDRGERDVDVYGPVDDLALLEDGAAVRLLVELELGPGTAWDPPQVDEVRLAWREPGRRRGAER
jgi:hypothetical protein